MRTFELGINFAACKTLTHWSKRGHDKEEMVSDQRKGQSKIIKSFEGPFREIGFGATAASMSKLAKKVLESSSTYADFAKISEEALGRLIDESEQRQFFALTPRESEHYGNPRQGWEASISRLPQIVDDVEEAHKCFALSRYPAAVFHSIQVVESGLIELGKFLDVNDPLSGWTSVSSALEKVMEKKHSERTKFEKKNFAFLEQVHGTVAGLKNAWRNKISHSHGKLILMTSEFSPEVAEEILFASRAFMRRLADGLPKRKSKGKRASSLAQLLG